MHRRIAVLIFVIFYCFHPVLPAQAEVLDRIAAVVEGRIITLSDIRKEHSIRAVLGDKPESDDALLQSMIDQVLLEEDMAQYPGLDVSDDEVNERMKNISDFHGIAPDEIRNAEFHAIQRNRYLTLRFRQFIVVSNEDIKNYYDMEFVPEARKRGAPVPELNDEVQAMIRTNLFDEKLSVELDNSLKDLRKRSNFEVF